MTGAGGQGQLSPPLPHSWHPPRPRRHRRRTEGQSSPLPGMRRNPGRVVAEVPGAPGPSSRPRTQTPTGGTDDGLRQRSAGQAYRGAEVRCVSGGCTPALHPTARAGGRRPGGRGESRRPLPANLAAGPGPSQAVGGSVPESPGVRLSAPPHGRALPARRQLSALPRAAPSAPPGRQHRGARAGLSAGLRGPMAPAAPRRRLPRPLSGCHPGCPPPCAHSLPRCARLPPRPPGGRCPAATSPPGPSPPLSAPSLPGPSLGLPRSRCLPASLSPSRRPPSLSPASPSARRLSSARLSLPPAPSLSFLVFLSPALSARPAVSDPGPTAAASPARPGARAPAARGAENSQLGSRRPVCETFAPPRT